MEYTAIIVAVIAAFASVFGAIFTFFSNRSNSKSSKATSIMEEQYLKVVAPIHKALSVQDENMCENIHSIIYDNYELVPDELISDFWKSYRKLSNKDEDLEITETSFGRRIDKFYKILRKKLGYSKASVSRKDLRDKRLLAASNKKRLYSYSIYVFLGIVSIIGCVLFYLIMFELPSTTDSFTHSPTSTTSPSELISNSTMQIVDNKIVFSVDSDSTIFEYSYFAEKDGQHRLEFMNYDINNEFYVTVENERREEIAHGASFNGGITLEDLTKGEYYTIRVEITHFENSFDFVIEIKEPDI